MSWLMITWLLTPVSWVLNFKSQNITITNYLGHEESFLQVKSLLTLRITGMFNDEDGVIVKYEKS